MQDESVLNMRCLVEGDYVLENSKRVEELLRNAVSCTVGGIKEWIVRACMMA